MNRRDFTRTLFSLLAGTAITGTGMLGPGILGAGGARAATPLPRPRPFRVDQGLPRARVVLDPGHGGRDPGALGRSGVREKDVTLDICRTIRDQIQRRGGPEVLLTRDRDIFLPLQDRIGFADRQDADLFISIHADAAPTPQPRGLSAYTLSDRASDGLASALATTENRADSLYGVDLRHADAAIAAILQDLALRYSHQASRTAKEMLVSGLVGQLDLLDNPMRSAAFAVLKSAQVPAVLVETGFLSNPRDERLLADTDSRREIARILGNRIALVASELRLMAGA